MVEKVRLTPQRVSAPGGGSTVPRLEIGSSIDLRSAPSLDTSGLGRAMQGLQLSAAAFRNTGQGFEALFADQVKSLREGQQAEAERIYAEDMLSLENSLAAAQKTIDPRKDDYGQVALETFDKVTGDRLSQDGLSGYQKKILKERYTGQRLQVGLSAAATQSKLREDAREFDFVRYLEAQQNRLISNPSGFEAVLLEADDYLANAGFSPSEAEVYKEQAMEALSASAVLGNVSKNLGQAKAMLNDPRMQEMLDPRAFEALKRDIESEEKRRIAEAKAEQAQARAEQYAQARVKVSRGEASYTELDGMREAGVISSEQWASLTIGLDGANAAGLKLKEADLNISEALSGNRVLTDSDQKDFDSYYARNIAPVLTNLPPEQKNEAIARLTVQSGLVPKPVKDEIKAQIMSGDAASKMQAADIVARIQERNPFLDIGLDAQQQGVADQLNSIRTYTAEPADAVKQIETDLRNPAVAQARANDFKEKWDEQKALSKFTNEFDTLFGREPGLSLETGDSIRISGELRTRAENYYKANPDQDKAIERAIEDMRRTFAVTKVAGGGKRVMKYAPEAMYRPVNGSHKWIEEQVREDVGGEYSDIFLSSDPVTEREIGSGMSPGYSVYTQDDDGIIQELRDPETGRLQRFFPDERKALSANIDAAKEKRTKIKESRTLGEMLGGLD